MERMLDFISFCYSEEYIPCDTAAFKYCFIHYPSHYQLQRWASLCDSFYEADILYAGDPETLKHKKDAVIDGSIALMNSDKIINYVYSASKSIIVEAMGLGAIDVILLT
jgi:hypothetical protein